MKTMIAVFPMVLLWCGAVLAEEEESRAKARPGSTSTGTDPQESSGRNRSAG